MGEKVFVMEYMPGENFEDYIFLGGHVYTEREVLKFYIKF